MSFQKNSTARIIVGTVLIFIGAAILFDNFEFFDIVIPYEIREYLLRWQVLMIVIGIILFSISNRSAGVVLIVIGIIGLFPEIWPIFLVFIGGYLLYKKDYTKNHSKENGSTRDYIDDVAIFGGSKKTVVSQNFKGGKITSIFGGSEFDLRSSKLAPGEQVIDFFSMFGGSSLVIPDHWKVNIDMLPIFGGYSDKRRIPPQTEFDETSTLTLKGIVIFGGGEIRN